MTEDNKQRVYKEGDVIALFRLRSNRAHYRAALLTGRARLLLAYRCSFRVLLRYCNQPKTNYFTYFFAHIMNHCR